MVAESCDTSSATATVFDASFCSDPSGRPLQSLEWGQDLAAGNNPVLAAVVNEVNKGGSVKAKSLLSLPAASVAQLSDGDYTLTVRVTNFLGQSAVAKLAFKKVGPGTAPVISIVGGPTQSFKIADGVNLASVLEPTSVCAGKTVRVAAALSMKHTMLSEPEPLQCSHVMYQRLVTMTAGRAWGRSPPKLFDGLSGA